MRLKRAITSRMPFSSGNAPPDNPVPAPRATTGTSCADAYLQQRLDLLDGVGQRDQHRRDAIGGQAVAFERPQVFLCVQQLHVGQKRLQVAHDGGFVVVVQRAVEALVVSVSHAMSPGCPRLSVERRIAAVFGIVPVQKPGVDAFFGGNTSFLCSGFLLELAVFPL